MFNKNEMEQIENILKDDFTEVSLSQVNDNHIVFEGYSDAMVEIKVERKENKLVSIFDRYVTEKHYVHFKDETLI